MGVLTDPDLPALRALCLAWSHYRAADRVVQAEGLILGVGTMPHRHPAAGERGEWWARVRAGLADFGLNPAARGRVSAAPPMPEEDALGKLLAHRTAAGARS